MNNSPLAGKVALVTGGSRGIGAAIVRRLVDDGVAVVFTYSASGKSAEALAGELRVTGGRVLAIRADSGDVAAVQNAVKSTVELFGQLDILVNSAGIVVAGAPEDFAIEDFDRMMAVNVRAFFVAAQAAIPHLPDGGRIIAIGSINGDYSGFPGIAVYSATKAAVSGLVRGLARDLGPRGITVNDIQPGPTDSDMNPADGPNSATLKGMMATKRFGKDEEVAGLVAYLANPLAGGITGSSIRIDGGLAA